VLNAGSEARVTLNVTLRAAPWSGVMVDGVARRVNLGWIGLNTGAEWPVHEEDDIM
jgi:hypothetical protein